MLSERAEEILEALWIQTEEHGAESLDLGASRDEPGLEELIKLGVIKREQDRIYLLDKGRGYALGCVRRHRLAERLLTDVFKARGKIINEVGCKFEHLLHEGLEDKVCAILGHPRSCPHGKPIPPGRCCRTRGDKKALKVIAALPELDPKERGHVAYLQSQDTAQMQKLMSIGILPGMSVALLQKFPSYVIALGHSQFAVDKELASAIYVRLGK